MRKFYKNVAVVNREQGFAVELDGKDVKTPAGKVLTLPTKALAGAVASEWSEQVEKVNLKLMPLTTLSYAALDQVADNFNLIAREVGAYAGTDLICYRAETPIELREREEQYWDPIVLWLKEQFGLELKVVNGISHVAQKPETLEFVSKHLSALDCFTLAAMQRLTGLLGSLFLAMAIDNDKLEAEQAWLASRVDEDYQAELWGEDVEATALIEEKHQQFMSSVHFLALIKA